MLTYDPVAAVQHLMAADRRLAKLIAEIGPLTLKPQRMQSVFEALLRSIVYQQLSGQAAATIYGRVRELLPATSAGMAQAVAELPDDTLRKAGLSRAKTLAVKDLAARTLAGEIPSLVQLRKLDDEAIVERLTAVRGVGVWTVQMLLIFRLGRPDVLPVSDLGVRKGFQRVYATAELPLAAEIERRAKRWRPYCSAASWYLWRSVDPERPRPAARPSTNSNPLT